MLLGSLVGVNHHDVVIHVELAPPGDRHDLEGVAIEHHEHCDVFAGHHAVVALLLVPNLEVHVRSSSTFSSISA
jgi:hypothetical protein